MDAVASDMDAETVGALLRAGADVNTRCEKTDDDDPYDYTETVLTLAARWNHHPEVIKLLLEAGADVGFQDERGHTALTTAIMHRNSPEIIRLLLRAGADANVKCMYEYDYGECRVHNATPLMLATRYGTPEVIRALVDAGADIEAEDDFGLTAVMWAAYRNLGDDVFPHPDNVKALTDAGAAFTQKEE